MENEKSRSAWAAMKYSIIIPVYNRPDEVDELLESLTRQTVNDFEVVVVEDGSTVPCKEVVEKYRAVDSSQFTADSSHADEEKLSTLNSQLSTPLTPKKLSTCETSIIYHLSFQSSITPLK